MKKEHVIERDGRHFVLYAGLLEEAHAQGLKRIITRMIQAPGPENGHTAVCTAEVETAKGSFSGIGDASPENVGRAMIPHMIRMAETRAKARALRDAINVGMTAFEELGPTGPDRASPRADRSPSSFEDIISGARERVASARQPLGRPASSWNGAAQAR